MESFTIDAATDAERDWCAQLMAGTDPWITLGRSLEQCRAFCQNREYLLYVAHAEGRPCGFILMHRRGLASSPYIATIAVAEGFRSRGLGSRLLEFAEGLFRNEARHIFLCVSSFNARARALYERRGYTVVGELKDYIKLGASEIIMHKRLRQP
ncbi:MAG: GNAT family N-acetyltransferase [Acidobacteriia bacterium]|nr:GNAT family N-acetyltransferase [Terriglobia bacterium]